MKKALLSIVILCFGLTVHAQNEFLIAAEKYFAKGDYFSASQYYEKYLAGGKSNSGTFDPYAVSASTKSTPSVVANKETVLFKLAESYRLLNFHEKSAPIYRQVLDAGTNQPLASFHYASALRALGKHEEAEKEFTTFLSEYKEGDLYAEDAAREVKNIQYIKQQLNKKDIKYYTVAKAATGLNDVGGNYAPFWSNNKVYFTSTRPAATDKSKTYVNRIYEADYANSTVNNILMSTIEQPSKVEQGVITISPDGNTMFLTRWTVGEGKKSAAIYTSRKNDNKWSDPVLSDVLNATGTNTQQPSIMPDGKHLMFSSDRPGGNGGFDLWYAAIDNAGNPGTPVNMGSVNTKYDEQAPSYHSASGTLVFSSNGRIGMGGYDFFHSKGNIGSFAEPENFGYPVNSIKDDIYFTTNATAKNVLDEVILSSDREAACCLEMFTLNKKIPVRTVTGTVINCETKQPLANATISFIDPASNKLIIEKATDAAGSYSFTVEEYQELKATGKLTGYFANNITFENSKDEDAETLNNPPLCLTLIPEIAMTVENVYYDFNKSTLKEESFPSLDKLVTLLNENPTIEIELSAHTDSKGTDDYNLKLSDARAKSVVDYLISKGISAERLVAKGYGENAPVAENENTDGTDNPTGREKNRRTEFKVLKK